MNTPAGFVRPNAPLLKRARAGAGPCLLPASPFRYFNSLPELIRLAVMLYVKYPLSLRNVEDLLHERGSDISYETVRYWWNRFGPMFAADIRRQRLSRMRGFRQWQWHLDEMYVKVNGEMRYLRRAVDHEGEILESFVTRSRDTKRWNVVSYEAECRVADRSRT